MEVVASLENENSCMKKQIVVACLLVLVAGILVLLLYENTSEKPSFTIDLLCSCNPVIERCNIKTCVETGKRFDTFTIHHNCKTWLLLKDLRYANGVLELWIKECNWPAKCEGM